MRFLVQRAGQLLSSFGSVCLLNASRRAVSNAALPLRGRSGSSGQASIWMMVLGFMLGGSLLVILGLRFPGEASRWMETRDEIQKLREENTELRKYREEREGRLKKFLEHHDSIELEIRRQLELHHPNDTIYVLPPKSPARGSENSPQRPTTIAP